MGLLDRSKAFLPASGRASGGEGRQYEINERNELSPGGRVPRTRGTGSPSPPPSDPFAAFPAEVRAELAALRATLASARRWCGAGRLPLLDTLMAQALAQQAPAGAEAVRAMLEDFVEPMLARWREGDGIDNQKGGGVQ